MHEKQSCAEKSLSSSITKKLGMYAAIGIGGSTFAVSAADADIIYTDLRGGNELFINSENSQSLGIDLDNDGNLDFQISFFTNTSNGFGTVGHYANLRNATGAPNNSFQGISQFAFGASVFGAPPNHAFSHFNNYWYQNGALARHYTNFFPSYTGGQFLINNNIPLRFAEVRFVDGTGTGRFGWIELENAVNFQNGIDVNDFFIVSRYAYAIDEPIVTGQTASAIPEPSAMTSLGLLALGAAGVSYRRRKKHTNDEQKEESA